MKYLQLIRYKNLIFIALLLLLMRYCVVIPWLSVYGMAPGMNTIVFIMLVLATICIAAGGYVINDYFDVKIDMLNRAEKVIVDNTVERKTATLMHQVFTVVGVVLGLLVAFLSKSKTLGLIFIFVPGLLWFYSASYKRQFLIGNIIISFCSALVPIIEVLAEHSFLMLGGLITSSNVVVIPILYKWICGFALFAFLTTLIREIIKDMQDEYGDREFECRTMAVVWGINKTKYFLYALIVLTMIILSVIVMKYIDFPKDNISVRYLIFGGLLPFVYLLYLIYKAKRPADFKQASTFVKFIMGIGSLYALMLYFLLSMNYQIPIFGLFQLN